MKKWTLEQKKALVTGGSKGIGKAVVAGFLELGAEVLFTARNREEVNATELAYKELGYPVTGVVADVSVEADRMRLSDWVTAQWGTLDILVNNAGINIRKPTNDYLPAELQQVLDINLKAPFELCRLFFPLLEKAPHAAIVNISSVAGSFDVQTGAPYGMSKAGLIQLSRNLANEWAAAGIRVNTVSPWFTETPLTEKLLSDKEKLDRIVAATPLRRVAQPEEVAAAVAFLAMDQASYITGQNLSVDGGISIRVL